ncbi:MULTISPECIES: LysR family transcriptional regulator [unclassified Paracoccus (in: a-proteobacteria)]|uniref:LysR family transcriptional regulator n=1 Tax=unclassified Paracoccus (in: a-proteobacteria) TaxID=2688777 RepID=UPI0012B33E73|nr:MULTISPECIES: LysR family transcriptional regulator [unclassified Paracoccus (in: a-proteobacteria)]UXU73896.1 LysR family transcriptional regulator [Paracoccus sp. SMMA_5]UXU79784.1 LysR family transcriptional regulator [Paracoccus sp. SMMA_5_TC]
MQPGSWDDIRIALAVARHGTVSGAAAALGIHHATVIRRIDALEDQLGARLFQRHARGYTPTEAGRTLIEAGGAIDARLVQMAAQIAGSGDEVAGDIVVTSLPELADLVMPRLAPLLRTHPGLRLRYLTDPRLYRLEAGEAHVALRAGARPTEPDYVVARIALLRPRLYASPDYLARHGAPTGDLSGHRFVLSGAEARAAPHMRWFHAQSPAPAIAMISNDAAARLAMVRQGVALGFCQQGGPDLIEVMALPEWESPLWLVTHVDLHRTAKVQAVVRALRG